LAIASLSRVQVEEQLFSDSDESIVAYITRFALHNLP
jgi:phage FluMu gp28-like protein